MQNFKDYYQILGLTKQATADEIKAAYRKLARKYHPDVNQNDPKAEEKFKDLNEAYEVLSDQTKRRQYDQFGQYHQQSGFKSASRASARSASTGSAYSSPYSTEDFGFGGFSNNVDFTQFDDFQDFIDQLLGRVGQPGKTAQSNARAATDTSPYDTEATLPLTIPEAYQGGKRRLRVEGGRILEINIPPAIKPGKRIRLKGQGSPSPSGGSGDLYLTVEFKEHPFYRQLDGADLYCELPISPSEAVLGAQIEVPTLDGRVKLKIPAGVQAGQKLRLSSRGFPNQVGERGDQYVTIRLDIPERVSSEERDLYEKLQRIQSYDPRARIHQ